MTHPTMIRSPMGLMVDLSMRAPLFDRQPSTVRGSNPGQRVYARVLDAWQRWRAYRETCAELAALSPRTRADIGIAERRIEDVARESIDEAFGARR